MGKINTQITDRDLKILELLKKFGHVREDLLSYYFNLNYSQSKNKVLLSKLSKRLEKFIKKEKYIYNNPFYWSLTKYGSNFIESKEIKIVNYNILSHNDYVTEVGVELLKKEINNVETEFEIKQNIYGKEAKNLKIPDIILNETTAIEIEISCKNDSKLISIINNYKNMDYTNIIYYSNKKQILNKIYKYTQNDNRYQFKFFSKKILESIDHIGEIIKDDFRDSDTGRFKSNNELAKRLTLVGKRK